jgi:uncharacterized membrane-anchored protein
MEPRIQTKRANSFFNKALFVSTLCFLTVSDLLSQSKRTGGSKITVGEIVLYVAIIVAVIAVAWFFSSRQTDMLDEEQKQQHQNTPRKHYDHPNDPHFRKLRKKTS